MREARTSAMKNASAEGHGCMWQKLELEDTLIENKEQRGEQRR
jgi:hypothetical protein